MKSLTIRMKADDVAEILLYDEIGESFFGEGITAKAFREQIKALKAKAINLRINSPGGSVTEGEAMLTALDEFKGVVEVDVDGIAASAASVVAMAGDTVRMASNALMMIHDPYAMVQGGAEDMRRMAGTLDKVKGQIVDAYMRRAKVARDRLNTLMADETWLTGPEAVEIGLADSTTAPMNLANRFNLAKFKYRHVPRIAAQMSPFDIQVSDCVNWLMEDQAEMCVELMDGCVEAIEANGPLGIPGTSLTMTGTADDPAVRIVDEDDDECCWYLVPMSKLRKGDMDMDQPGMGGGMYGKRTPEMVATAATEPARGPEWQATLARKQIAETL